MNRKERFTSVIIALFCIGLQSAAYCHDITNVSEGTGKSIDSKYLKKTGNKWTAVIRGFERLKILDEKVKPEIKEKVFQNSNLFLHFVAYPVGSWPEAVAIGDVNGDGRNDVVMTTSFYFDPESDYHIFVFLQNVLGELEPPVKYSAGNGNSVDIGDLNNDGRNDVVVTAHNAIGVFYQNGSGGLNPMVTYPSNHFSVSNTYKLRIGDFNNDGLLDVVSIDWGTQSPDVDVFLQNINGTLNPPVTYSVTHGGYDDLDVGDVNNDGLTDIIVMSGQGFYPNIGVLHQEINGTFGLPVYYDLGEDELTRGVAVGDINGDILEDIVVSYGGNQPNSFIGTFLQNNSGTLNPAISYPSYDIPEAVEIEDVNFDGRNDVIVAHGGWMAMGVYLQGAEGTLLPYELYQLPYASHYNPHGLDVGDINSDGANDVVIADYNYGLVVLYHTPIPPEPDIKANNSDGPLIILQGTILTITVSLVPGSYSGKEADWWVAATSPFGLYWYTLDSGWVRSNIPIRGYGGPLFNLSPYQVLNTTTLPIGDYTFYFGVDLLMNGVLNFDQLYYDGVNVDIE
ncbi:MAG: VCBS repeat-containing protein [bacterium]